MPLPHVRPNVNPAGDRQVTDAGRATDAALRDMGPHVRGETVSFEFTAAETLTLNHKLGRQPEGWQIVDRDSMATICRDSWNARTITLTSSAAAVGKAWVF